LNNCIDNEISDGKAIGIKCGWQSMWLWISGGVTGTLESG